MSVIVEELSDLTTSERYLRFGRLVGRQQSRLAEELSLWVAQDPGLLSWLDELPVAHRHPQLLFSAIRYLGGTPGSGAGLQRWVRTEGDALRKVMLGRSTQLNEPGRCAPLLPLLATIRQPLALLEVGASAGLCLYPDRYGYDFSGEQVGDPSSAVQLRCEVAGPMPAPAIPQVMWRAGIDLNPLSPSKADDLRWLQALCWPGADDRLRRVQAAAKMVMEHPLQLTRGDANETLRAVASTAPADATLVVFHSATLSYLDPASRLTFARTVREIGSHWISQELPHVFPDVARRVRYWPQVDHAVYVLALDERPFALTRMDGGWLSWIDGSV